MVDAVNDAEDVIERSHAADMLAGWRECADFLGDGWIAMDADLHTMAKYGADRPVCCGVLLDWTPQGQCQD